MPIRDDRETSHSEAASKSEYVDRAQRFPIHAPMQYREGGETAWHEGNTLNISRSGVLFTSEQELENRKVLEMRIAFPPEMTGGSETKVVCWGPVVRRQLPAINGLPAFAATIFRYRFQHT